MKKSPKHVVNAAFADRAAAGGGGARARAVVVVDEMHDEAGLALFAGIHASKQFTKENAHRAFAGVKRKK